jgi:hypothetical protein
MAGLPDGIIAHQKISILVNFGGPWNGILVFFRLFGTFYGYLLGIFSHLGTYIIRTKSNLATLMYVGICIH